MHTKGKTLDRPGETVLMHSTKVYHYHFITFQDELLYKPHEDIQNC